MGRVFTTMLVAMSLGGLACSSPQDPSHHQEAGEMNEADAVELALQVLQDKGWDRERYDMSVEESADAWTVSFVGRDPRPPGDEMTVIVDKKSGETVVHQGE